MTRMIERIACVLDPISFQNGWANRMREARQKAREVLIELRDPSDEMIEAVAPWPEHWPKDSARQDPSQVAAYQADQLAARSDWQVMIDTAIGTEEDAGADLPYTLLSPRDGMAVPNKHYDFYINDKRVVMPTPFKKGDRLRSEAKR